MQPQAAHVGALQAEFLHFLDDHGGDHRHDFLEHLAAFLDEQLVGLRSRLVDGPVGAVQKAEIVADIVGENGLQPGTQYVPMPRRRDGLVLDQNRGGDVAEDEMAVAVAPVEVARTDFGIHDEHAPCMPRTNIVGRGLDAEGCRGAGDIHVEGKAVDAQRLLNLDRHRGVGALHVRRRAQHRIDVGGIAAGARQRVLCGRHADFGEDRQLVIGPLGKPRRHMLGVQNARLVDDVARPDAARLFDEFDARFSEFVCLARCDRRGIFPIVQRNIPVKTGDKFFVGDAFGGGEEAGGGNDRLRCVRHGCPCVSYGLMTR